MRLRITSENGRDIIVANAETGERLEGVDRVEWSNAFLSQPKVTLYLTDAAIDVTIDANRVEAVTTEDGKYAHTKLLDIARLRWRS